MNGLFGLIKHSASMRTDNNSPDSFLFSTAFADQGVDACMLVPWEARANEVGAKRLPASRGGKLLQDLWSRDTCMARLERFFDFATLPGNRDVIRQDEYSNFMIVLLNGTIAVEREQPWGERLRLTEARPGDILGEMSLLDSGMRFSVCTQP